MRTKYLLPCSCGEKIPVDTSQAGGRVQCGCGEELSVPSMRGLRSLETAEVSEPRAAAEAARPAWGPRQGLMLAGVLLVVLAIIPAGLLYRQMPEKLRFDVPAVVTHNHEQIDQLPITETWVVWKEDILGRGLIEYPLPEKQYNEYQRTMHQRWITFALCFAAVGVLMIVGSLAMPKPARPKE